MLKKTVSSLCMSRTSLVFHVAGSASSQVCSPNLPTRPLDTDQRPRAPLMRPASRREPSEQNARLEMPWLPARQCSSCQTAMLM